MNTYKKIAHLSLETPFVAAPLAGITDAPTRRIFREYGASLVYSEMISAKGLWYKDKNTGRLLEIYDEEKPVAFQLFGSEPEVMRYAARELAGRENAMLDINMGCPVPKVVKNGEGSALLKDLDKLFLVAEAVVKGAAEGAREQNKESQWQGPLAGRNLEGHSPSTGLNTSVPAKPVTAKIRLGWDEGSKVYVEAARMLEAAGVSAVAVHGRTREQYYTGKADWGAIAEVKQAVSIPVIGNGDVFSAEDALAMLRKTGCDFVMIARGALGNPWIFREANALWHGEEKPAPPTLDEKIAMILRHLGDLIAQKGEYAGVREMRKFVGWYLKGVHGSAAVRREINELKSAEEIKEKLLAFSR